MTEAELTRRCNEKMARLCEELADECDNLSRTARDVSITAVAYCIFLSVVFRGSSVRRSTARRCALARNIGAGGPHDRTRTCDAAILTHA